MRACPRSNLSSSNTPSGRDPSRENVTPELLRHDEAVVEEKLYRDRDALSYHRVSALMREKKNCV